MLLRGVGPHLHPRTDSSGVVWGRPAGSLPTCSGSYRWGRLQWVVGRGSPGRPCAGVGEGLAVHRVGVPPPTG